ncbi:MAG: ORF6N domain-containing protein [Ruminococcus sp.]|nr:ORF6N domain-containing protein [Ruminococcus sp.]
METVNINDVSVEIKEYMGHRVVTFKDIDRVHGRPDGTARRNFNGNRKHFIEGEDYFKVCAYEIRTHKIMDISPKTHEDIILLTESGYLMIVKSFTDDLAWSVQRQLVNSYFRTKELLQKDLYMIEYIKSLERRIERLEETKPTVSKSVLPENNSIVFDFINECCERRCGTCNNITTADLYRAFEKWCLKKNTNAVSKYDFINQVCEYFRTDEKKSIRKNVAGKWYYLITLTPSAIKDLI